MCGLNDEVVMKSTAISLLLLSLMTSTVTGAQELSIVTIMSKDLTGLPGKEVLMITVDCLKTSVIPTSRSSRKRQKAGFAA